MDVQATTVTLASGLRLGAIDDLGNTWRVADLAGWDDAMATGSASQRTSAHGSWATPGYYGAKAFVVAGTCLVRPTTGLVESSTAYQEAVAWLMRHVPGPMDEEMVVVREGDAERYVMARLEGVVLTRRTGSNMLVYSVPLACTDWRRFTTGPPAEASTPPRSVLGGLVIPQEA